MTKQHFFTVSVFLVFILALPGITFGQRVIDLDKLWGDMRVMGSDDLDKIGYTVDYGDINGDGYNDIVIGAHYASPDGRTATGETYIIFGSSSPPSTVDLSIQQADIFVCGKDNDAIGFAVASGDVNGDGFDDIIISNPYRDTPGGTCAGKTYVIFGEDFTPPVTIDLSTDQADITVLGGQYSDATGWALATGDINNDGYDDMVITADSATTPAGGLTGKTYVFFGKTFSTPLTIDLSTDSADITILGASAGDSFGQAAASGDINGDGFDDIIIGADYADPPGRTEAGETYVILGSSFASPPYTIDLSSEPASITILGAATDDCCGEAVASGDVNNDGLDDIIIGAICADPGGRSDAGETYVIFGFNPTYPCVIDLSFSSADITVCGANAVDLSGYRLDCGDVNGNGYDDLIISANLADPGGRTDAGETYVIFGFSSSSPVTIDLSTQSADITLCGDNADDELSYWGVASGDVNGDSYADVIVGAAYANPSGRTDAGETYLTAGGGAIITAHGLGGKSWIKEFSLLARDWGSFKAFGGVNSQGEVHLAIGDIDADNLDEIAAGQGEGGKSWVKFFEVNGSKISGFKAFGTSNTNGELHLTIGNFDADTSDNEIAIAQGEGGQSWVKVFETDATFISSIKAFGAANAEGEVHLASGDLENADGVDEIVAGMGEGGSSRVKIFNYDGTVIRSFKAFEVADNPGGEVRLAVGNFDADADLEIAASTGYDGGNLVRLFDKDGTLISGFTAFGFGGNTNGDVQIAAADIDNDGIDELICGHGEGGNSAVKVFKPDGTSILSFKAFGGVNAQGKVNLGKSNY